MAIKERINILTFTDNPDVEYQINDATGENSFAYGTNLKVTGDNQVVFGKNNRDDKDLVFAIGNGKDGRKNILEVYKDGRALLNDKPLFTGGGDDGEVQTTASAIDLEEPINFTAKLDSDFTQTGEFDGTIKNVTVPVTGILPITKGGTGSDQGIKALVDLSQSSSSPSSIGGSNTTIPVKGTLPATNGGTGTTSINEFKKAHNIPTLNSTEAIGKKFYWLEYDQNDWPEGYFQVPSENGGVVPYSNGQGSVGTSDYKWNEMHSKKFIGDLQGTAEAANKLNHIFTAYNNSSDAKYINFATLTFTANYSINSEGSVISGGQYADMPIKFEFTLRTPSGASSPSAPGEAYINFNGAAKTDQTTIGKFNVNGDIEMCATETTDSTNKKATIKLYCKLKGYDSFTLHNVILSPYYNSSFNISYWDGSTFSTSSPSKCKLASKGLPINLGGTGATTAEDARKNLGVIGMSWQNCADTTTQISNDNSTAKSDSLEVNGIPLYIKFKAKRTEGDKSASSNLVGGCIGSTINATISSTDGMSGTGRNYITKTDYEFSDGKHTIKLTTPNDNYLRTYTNIQVLVLTE